MTKLKYLSCCLLLLSMGFSVIRADEDPIEKIGWNKIEDLTSLDSTARTEGSQTPIPLLTIKSPPITERNHAIGGEIRYTDVAKTGNLEMWTYYEKAGPFFSRTLGKSGPTAKLIGDSEWRPVLLPFFGEGKSLPTKLELNLILRGSGKVEFRNFGLYQLPGNRTGHAWWGSYTGNMIGAIGGSLIGVWCGICGWLAAKGRGQRFVLNSFLVLFVVGVACLIAAVVAGLTRQPYIVWYPLALGGVLLVPICFSRYRVARKSYLERELRAISAVDQ